MSRRASESPTEFVAEVYALLRQDVAIDAEVLSLYDSLGGP